MHVYLSRNFLIWSFLFIYFICVFTQSRSTAGILLMALVLRWKFSVLICDIWLCGMPIFFALGFVFTFSSLGYLFLVWSYLMIDWKNISAGDISKDSKEKKWPSPICRWAWERFSWGIGLHFGGCKCFRVYGNNHVSHSSLICLCIVMMAVNFFINNN